MNRGRFQPRGDRSFRSFQTGLYGSALLALLAFAVATPSFAADPEEGLVTKLVTDPKKDTDSALPGEVPSAVDDDIIKEIKDGLTNPKYEKCRASLPTRLKDYETALADLKKYAATTPPPTPRNLKNKEDDLNAIRKKYLTRVSECGPCRARIVTSWKGKGSDFWYATDGSCFVDSSDAKGMGLGFEAATKSLRARADYLGFPHIVKVETLTADKKAFETGAAALSDKFAAFLAIRTPLEFLGKIQTFFYHIENNIVEDKDALDSRTFSLTFSSFRRFKEKTQSGKELTKIEKLPVEQSLTTKFSEETFWKSPGGRKMGLLMMELKSVAGMWFINENGALRYYTVGDFILESAFVQQQANDVLLEALLEMYRRFQEGGKLAIAGGTTP